MSDDWRFDGETGTDAGDYFLGQRKRVDIEKRRPVIRRASDLVGPGIDAQAVRVTNWNDTLATFDGYYSSLPGASGAPDMIQNFIGTVVMDADMGGIQTLTGVANKATYRRLFLRNPGDSESITFDAWRSSGAGWKSLSGVAPGGTISYQTTFDSAYITMRVDGGSNYTLNNGFIMGTLPKEAWPTTQAIGLGQYGAAVRPYFVNVDGTIAVNGSYTGGVYDTFGWPLG